MKIIQLLPTISYGDAVSNDTLAIKRSIEEMGIQTQIYAENVDTRLPRGTAMHVSEMPELNGEDIIIYHASTGSELNDQLPKLSGRKIMIYHNVTPAKFFRPYSAQASILTQKGLDGIRYLADKVEYCIADSDYNKEELLRMGYTCPIDVCPILIPFEDYEKKPSEKILSQYQGDGYTNLLFVGRIAPNKKQEDVIRAFYQYQKQYNKKSRLILAGSWSGMEAYHDRLEEYVEKLELTDQVIFTGHIKFDELLAYYRLADVFVCMSEHEGFCVPLIEAMYFGIPIMAINGTAIPYTLGGSGVLLDKKDPIFAAALIDRIVNDSELREYLVEKQKERLQDFSYEKTKDKFIGMLSEFIAHPKKKKRRIIQLTSSISYGDAVSNDIIAFRDAIVKMGSPTVIYSENIPNKRMESEAQNIEKLPKLKQDDVLIYHHATGTNLARKFASMPGKKVMVYHNVTPPHFFASYDSANEYGCQWGLKNLAEMRRAIDFCVADSEFNKTDLKNAGYNCPISVCPILVPFDDYKQNPDAETISRFNDGKTNVVFLGRVAPNKKFEDVISAFAAYKNKDTTARLILVGAYDENGKYYKYLQQHVKSLGVQDVFFTGHISFSKILAYYHIADVFLCMSEHEGFCVPLIEAMFFNIPIIAYDCTAIPDTLGGSGVLLKTKEPEYVAEEMWKIKQDQAYRQQIIDGQRKRLEYFSYENTMKTLEDIIHTVIKG